MNSTAVMMVIRATVAHHVVITCVHVFSGCAQPYFKNSLEGDIKPSALENILL